MGVRVAALNPQRLRPVVGVSSVLKEWKVALLIETARGYGREVLRGIVRYASLRGGWSFYITPGDLQQALPAMRQWGGTGIIARIQTPQIAAAIIASGLPTIALDLSAKQTSPDSSLSRLSELATGSHEAGRMAAEHLLEKGFRHYAFVGIHNRVWSDRREVGFVARIAEAGFHTMVYRSPRRKRDRQWGVEQGILSSWLSGLPKPLGLMACNDDRGREVLEACRAAHLRVPEEIAVIGVDNDSLLCDLASPPLSSVVFNAERGGYEAAAHLERMMAGEDRQPRQIVVEPLYVVSRHSTDMLALDDPDVSTALRFIRRRAGHRVHVSEIAESVGLSRRTLEVRFRKALGRSLNAEIQRVRMEKVKQLLSETDWPLAKVAESAGYTDCSYLHQVFKEQVGMTPAKYRRSVRMQ
jgi:LacI family transcriptional regulator